MVSIHQLKTEANLFHFVPVEYLDSICCKREFYFKSTKEYEDKSLEFNQLYIDGSIYKANNIGVYCFTTNHHDLTNYNVWNMYGDKKAKGSACVGFWESGSHVPHSLVNGLNGISRYSNNISSSYHDFGEKVFRSHVMYNEIKNNIDYKDIDDSTWDNAKSIFFITNVYSSDSIQNEVRFITYGGCLPRSLKWTSQYLKRIKVIIYGPDLCDRCAIQLKNKYNKECNIFYHVKKVRGSTLEISEIT